MSALQKAEPVDQPQTALVATPSHLLALAVQQGAELDKLERLMALQERWETNEARKAYLEAFAAFKDEAVKVTKGRKVTDGPLKGKSYAELHDVVNAVTPALSRNGLSASWRVSKDEKDWIEVTCSVRHVSGHSESVSFGGPPDNGGAKNAIQARASTVTYLERYTLKAILGLAEEEDDNDGNGAGRQLDEKEQSRRDDWLESIKGAADADALAKVKAECCKAYGMPDKVPRVLQDAFRSRTRELKA
jgi:hypothetical protein